MGCLDINWMPILKAGGVALALFGIWSLVDFWDLRVQYPKTRFAIVLAGMVSLTFGVHLLK